MSKTLLTEKWQEYRTNTNAHKKHKHQELLMETKGKETTAN